MRKSKEQRFIERIYPDNLEAWPGYVKNTVAFNEAVRKRCQQKLAERRADMDAERENSERYRYHAAEATLLQSQIDHCTTIIQCLLALPSGPKWVNAEQPRRLPRPKRGSQGPDARPQDLMMRKEMMRDSSSNMVAGRWPGCL